MSLLHTIGLMTRAEHEALLHHKILHPVDPETDWEAKFKRAATDLAAQAEEIAGLKQHVMSITRDRNSWREEANTLRPDAEAMRKKRAADRKRMAVKRGKA